MKRIIFHAHAAVENLGDRLIVDSMRRALAGRLPDHELVFRDASPGTVPGAISLAREDLSEARREIDAADLVLIGGGELVGPHFGYLDVALAAAAADRPTVWWGVGGRISGGRLDRAYTRAMLRRADAVITRDPRAFAHLAQCVPKARLHDGVDVAFSWTPPLPASSETRPEFGVCLRGPEQRSRSWDRESFVRLAREIEVLEKHGLRPVFFSFLSERDAQRIGSPNIAGTFGSDDEVHAFVQEQMAGRSAEVVVAEGDLTRVFDRIRSLRFIVSMRLHALVIAAHARVPFVALDYAPKVEEFARLVDAEEWLVRPEEVSSKLPALTTRLLDPGLRAQRSHALGVQMDRLRQRASAQLELVAPLLENPRPRRSRPVSRALAQAWTRFATLHQRL